MKLNARKNRCLLAALCWFLTSGAHADFYSCRDNAGHLITSDQPIPECASKSTQVFQNNGILKNEIPASLTVEQRRAAELKEQQRAKEASHQEDMRREQRYLTAHYPNEASIEIARKQAINSIESKIAAESQSLQTANETLKKNLNAISITQKDQVAKIRELQLKNADLTQSIAESNHLIINYRAEETSVNSQFDATHKRYLEIIPIH
jgi:hypothetical protein